MQDENASIQNDLVTVLKAEINKALPEFRELEPFQKACEDAKYEYGKTIFMCLLKARDQIERIQFALDEKLKLPEKIASLKSKIDEINTGVTHKRANRELLKRLTLELAKAESDLNENIDAEVEASRLFVLRKLEEARDADIRMQEFVQLETGEII